MKSADLIALRLLDALRSHLNLSLTRARLDLEPWIVLVDFDFPCRSPDID